MSRITEKLISTGCNIHPMANRHVKIINGRKYYYQSIRKGRKVTSKYLGPVDKRIRKKKDSTEELILPEESYIG